MSYEDTRVSVSDSQGAIRKIVYAHRGGGISFISRPPTEGFEALVDMGGKNYHIRVMATCKPVDSHRGNQEGQRSQEERRVWRVLYWHLKAMFEAADSGVIAVEDIIMPYVVTRDGRTLAEHFAPHMQELEKLTNQRLLAAAGFTPSQS